MPEWRFASSFAGHSVGMPEMSAYAASKAGQIGRVKALAAELGSKGIRANALLPGGTDTPASVTNAPGATERAMCDHMADEWDAASDCGWNGWQDNADRRTATG